MVEKPLGCCIKYVYFPKPNKNIFTVKPENESKAAELFNNTSIKITSSRLRNVGVVIGNELYLKEYNERIVIKWWDELLLLSKITEVNKKMKIFQSDYYSNQATSYGQFTIIRCSERNQFTPVINGDLFVPVIYDESSISENLRPLIALPIRLGGKAVTIPHLNSGRIQQIKMLTGDIVDHICQITGYQPNKKRVFEIKNNINIGRTEAQNTNLRKIRKTVPKGPIRANEILLQTGRNNWLNITLMDELNYSLKKNNSWMQHD